MPELGNSEIMPGPAIQMQARAAAQVKVRSAEIKSSNTMIGMDMLRIFAHLTIFLACAAPAAAQSWQSSTTDNGSLLFGSATLEGADISFRCTAPSPDGVPLIETGSHESHRNDPYELTIGLHDSLFEWSDPYVQTNVVIGIGDVGYRLPPVELNELQGTAVYLSMTDQMIQALPGASELVLATGQGSVHQIPTEGLDFSLRTALAHCTNRWMQMGHPLPVGLREFLTGEPAAEAPATSAPATALPPFIAQQLASACGAAGYSFDAAQGYAEADFDSDGSPDYIFSGYGLQCNQGLNPYCGASNCSVSVHLSSRGYDDVDGWIGGGFSIGTTANGRPGLRRFGEASRPLEVWNGTAFAPVQ